ncbi:MFS transporter [Streptomyces hoynatensis]|uniref:MFS transporter n=1 Tax=Streptomyces hoynatensis TaxID=1141874 RepID=A0A3A9Z055_9ACTN|nr:MFS transporter [Streptomyces hoynatensis]RKN41822.1 MFS transporter [Streptomyces hoynatensis]
MSSPVPRAGRAGAPPPPVSRWLLPVVLTVQFTVSLDTSVVNVALPAVRAGLGFDEDGLTWVVNAYALTFGGLMMLGGRLGDLFGRRRVLLAGLALFGAASLAGGLMRTPGLLIAARAVQGVGAAALTPVALALLTTAFAPGRALARALGLWGATAAAGGAAGVLAGGVLTEWLSWRAVMLINVPIVAFALAAARRLPADRRAGQAPPRLDAAGALLVTAGATALVLGVVRSEAVGWGSAATLLTLGAAAALLALFALVESRTRDPLLRMGLPARRPVLGANLFMMLLFSCQFAAFYFCSLHLHHVLGYGAARAGLAFLPFCLGVVAGSALAARAVASLGLRRLLVLGGLLAACGVGWLGAGMAAGGGYLLAMSGPMLLISVGIGMCFVPLGTAGTAGVPPEAAGMASGLLNTSRQVGGSVGLAALGTLATSVSGGQEGASREALAEGYGAAVGASAALLLLAVLAALLLIRDPAGAGSGRAGGGRGGTGRAPGRRAPAGRARSLPAAAGGGEGGERPGG